jgi:hypothetical protein
MSVLNRLAAFFGYQQPSANALAQQNSPLDPGTLAAIAAMRNRANQSQAPVFYSSIKHKGGNKFSYGKTLESNREPMFVQGYRYDRRRGALETLPKKFNMEDVRLYSTAIGDAIRAGVPGISENISPEIITAMLLKEGREDLGTNEYNANDPKSRAIYEKYAQEYGHEPAMTIAAMYDKAKVAKRLGIPFASAWIGTGRSPYETSAQYAADTENFKRIATDRKNQSLLNFIRGSMMPEPGSK